MTAKRKLKDKIKSVSTKDRKDRYRLRVDLLEEVLLQLQENTEVLRRRIDNVVNSSRM